MTPGLTPPQKSETEDYRVSQSTSESERGKLLLQLLPWLAFSAAPVEISLQILGVVVGNQFFSASFPAFGFASSLFLG